MKRNIHYKIVLSEEEYNFLENKIKDSGMNRRDFILKSAEYRKPLFKDKYAIQIIRELNSCGRNLNQYIRILNTILKNRDEIEKHYLIKTKLEVDQLWLSLKWLISLLDQQEE